MNDSEEQWTLRMEDRSLNTSAEQSRSSNLIQSESKEEEKMEEELMKLKREKKFKEGALARD